jgi:hypothetical protein
LKLKHVDMVAGCVNQDARDVKTKFSKTFNTYFFPVGEEIEVSCQRQGAIIRDLATPQKLASTDADKIAEAIYKRLRSSDMGAKKVL